MLFERVKVVVFYFVTEISLKNIKRYIKYNI